MKFFDDIQTYVTDSIETIKHLREEKLKIEKKIKEWSTNKNR